MSDDFIRPSSIVNEPSSPIAREIQKNLTSSPFLYSGADLNISGVDAGAGDSLYGGSPTDDLIVVIIWTLMLFYGLVTNIFVLIGVFGSLQLRRSTTYWLIVSLCFCDIFMVIISLFHIVPATLLHDRFLKFNSWRNVWALFFYDLFWYTGVLTLGLMAINRFCSIVYPNTYKVIFTPHRTLLIISFVYVLGMLVSIPTLFPCCHTLWYSPSYVTVYSPEDTNYFLVDIAVNSVSLITMIVCYGVIIGKVRGSRQALAKYNAAGGQGGSGGGGPVGSGGCVGRGPVVQNDNRNYENLSSCNKTIPSSSSNCNKQKRLSILTTTMDSTPNATKPSSSMNQQQDGNSQISIGGGTVSSSMNGYHNNHINHQHGSYNSIHDHQHQHPHGTAASNSTPTSIQLLLKRRASSISSVSKRETRLFVQFFIVSAIFLLTWVTWQWLPRIGVSKWIYFSMTCLFFINNGVNPTVYLIFNTTLRREVCKILIGYHYHQGSAVRNGIVSRQSEPSADCCTNNNNRKRSSLQTVSSPALPIVQMRQTDNRIAEFKMQMESQKQQQQQRQRFHYDDGGGDNKTEEQKTMPNRIRDTNNGDNQQQQQDQLLLRKKPSSPRCSSNKMRRKNPSRPPAAPQQRTKEPPSSEEEFVATSESISSGGGGTTTRLELHLSPSAASTTNPPAQLKQLNSPSSLVLLEDECSKVVIDMDQESSHM